MKMLSCIMDHANMKTATHISGLDLNTEDTERTQRGRADLSTWNPTKG
jgi:hypothetical protein